MLVFAIFTFTNRLLFPFLSKLKITFSLNDCNNCFCNWISLSSPPMLSLVIQSISCKNAPGIISFALEDKLINIGQCVEAGNNSDTTPFEV